jgi:alkanesulfonate monooxygenase SsuD/methylene tetrahydromethanopterin reductase-like flavin-dependent oxidoreductase (luciferase family)
MLLQSHLPAQLLTAIAIYRNNFQPSGFTYVIACINVIAADSDQEAARL